MKLTLTNTLTPAIALASLLAAGCSSDDDGGTNQPPMNPANVTAGVDSLGLTTLASLLEDTGLDTVLAGTGPFTLFAPSNAAFAALDADTLAFLTDPLNVADLEAALRYHVVAGDVSSAAASALSSAVTNNGADVIIDSVDGSLYINDARVATADSIVGNGRIHVIDSVLLPPAGIAAALTDRGFDNLLAAAAASSLDLTAAPITVLAPSDAAFETFATNAGAADFADFLAGAAQVDVDALLNAHIVSGAGNTASAVVTAGDATSAGGSLLYFGAVTGMAPTVDGIDITAFNIPTTQSLIHEIDGVIATRDEVVTVIAGETDLTALAANVTAITGLDTTLNGLPAATIFAPTDAAWADPALTALQNGSNDALLEEVLRYHVVADALQAREVITTSSVDNIDSDTITITVTGGVVTLSNGDTGAEVTGDLVETDLFARNAIVHKIDTVLLPPGFVLP
ncbi:fasciclin domain-containing protein [Saltatorellus ferox]